MVLTRSQTRTFCDRFAKKQDAQAFYEEAAQVFEFGGGTGRLALLLLTQHFSSSAAYLGIDLSCNMINIAAPRIVASARRAMVVQSDGSICFPLPDQSVDRVVATYGLDLLSETGIPGRSPRLIGCSNRGESSAWLV